MTTTGSHRLTLASSIDAPRLARQALDLLGPPDLSGVARDDVRLMLSELVANSVLHAGGSPYQPIELTIELIGRTLHVAVSDVGPLVDASTMPPPDPATGGGWGLHLVGMLASDWGVDPDRDEVWFDVDLDAERQH